MNQHNWKDCTDVPYEQRRADGTLSPRFKDVTGQRFGMLTAVKPIAATGGKAGKHLRWKWVFRCDCGAYVERFIANVVMSAKKGHTPACPACMASNVKRKRFKHGDTGSKLYRVWRGMRNRCQNPGASAYPRYGGRGISVCERWMDYRNFVEDMGGDYYAGLVLDRIDTNGNYCKENCRWTSYRVNGRNRAGTYQDIDVAEFSRVTGIGKSTIQYRIDHGWPLELLALAPSESNVRLKAYLVSAKYKRAYMTSSTVGQGTDSSSKE